ncbi:MAG TPA: hypothetical protein DCG65_02725, partial [Hyphomonas atlantica]|nr:hypothetical protein [Hyphomonas atlantica]
MPIKRVVAATVLAIGLCACATAPAQDETRIDADATVKHKKVVRIEVRKPDEVSQPGPGDRMPAGRP